MVRCTIWGYATAVDSARMWREGEDEKKSARQADIKEGTGATLLLRQILYELITYHSKDIQKLINYQGSRFCNDKV